jgi:hypothetical protein
MRLLRDFEQTITSPVAVTTEMSTIHEPISRGVCAIGSLVNDNPAAVQCASPTLASRAVQDLTYTSKIYGTEGNYISVTYINPLAVNSPIAVAVVSDSQIEVSLATSNVAYESQTITFTGGIPTSGAIGLHFSASIDTSIDWSQNAANLQSNLRNNFPGYESVTCTGSYAAGAIVVNFIGLAGNRPMIQVDGNTLANGGGPITANITETTNYSAGGVLSSTAAQIKTAIEGNATANALVTIAVTGTGSTVQTAQAQTSLQTGSDGNLSITANTFTAASHGYATGLKAQLTTTGSLPTGLSLATNYWLIDVDTNTLKFASSLANALSGTAIDLTAPGSGTHTVTPATLDVRVKLTASNDGVLYVDVPGAYTDFTNSGDFLLQDVDPMYDYLRVVFQVNAGQITVPENHIIVKG